MPARVPPARLAPVGDDDHGGRPVRWRHDRGERADQRYGDRLAVDRLRFRVRPGRVTGFLGPNGAGKSTTMRLILGLAAPSGGSMTVRGRRYRDLPAPLAEVGALLDARAVHGGHTARDHLRWLARSNRIPARRVGEVLELVGQNGVAGRRVREYSLGMAQRLGIADDQAMVREGFSVLLGAQPGIEVVGEAVDGRDAADRRPPSGPTRS